MKLIHTYATCLYGFNLWDIFSEKCEKVYTSYNVAVRNALNLDRMTHRYFIEPLSGYCHLKSLVASRLLTFAKSLVECKKFPVRFLSRLHSTDLRTVLGRTLATIAELCKIDRKDFTDLSPLRVKQSMVYREVMDKDRWKVSIAKELLDICSGDAATLEGFSPIEAKEMLDFICVT